MGSKDALELFDNFLLDVGFHVEKSKELEKENLKLKSEIDMLKTDIRSKQARIAQMSKKLNEMLDTDLQKSSSETNKLDTFVRDNHLLDKTMRLQFEIDKVTLEKNNLQRDISLLRSEHEREMRKLQLKSASYD